MVLATVFSASLHHLCRSIAFRFGGKVKWWFLLFTLSSFHIPYYAGRTIPNFMALPIGEQCDCSKDVIDKVVLFGVSLILRSSGLSIPEPIRRKRLRNAIGLLTAASTIVRLEIALFLLPVVLSLVIQRRLSLSNALLYGAVSGIGSLGTSLARLCMLLMYSRVGANRPLSLATNPHSPHIPLQYLETTNMARTFKPDI